MDQSETPCVRAFYHSLSGAVQYVVSDPATRECAIIDPVLDFDIASGRFHTGSADVLLTISAPTPFERDGSWTHILTPTTLAQVAI